MKKGASREELSKSELIQLMQMVQDFLVTKTGEKPELAERKTMAVAINQLFPTISTDFAFSKINQRFKNARRRKVVQNSTLLNTIVSGQPIDETDYCEERYEHPNVTANQATNESTFENVEYLDENGESDSYEDYEL